MLVRIKASETANGTAPAKTVCSVDEIRLSVKSKEVLSLTENQFIVPLITPFIDPPIIASFRKCDDWIDIGLNLGLLII